MIILTKEETALLLAIKGHNLEILPMVEYESYSGYIKRVAGLAPGCSLDKRSFNCWVLRLWRKIFGSEKDYEVLLNNMFNINSSIIYYNDSFEYVISDIRLRKVSDLILDESIKTISKE